MASQRMTTGCCSECASGAHPCAGDSMEDDAEGKGITTRRKLNNSIFGTAINHKIASTLSDQCNGWHNF